MGRPDGVWSMKSDRRLGYECKMTFKNGVPVGKRVFWDDIYGNVTEVYNEEGLLISYTENGKGWKYKDGVVIPLEISKEESKSIHPFFLLDGEDDDFYFAHGGELYSWLKIYPYMASDEKPIVKMFRVKDGEDWEFIEDIGSPNY